MVLTHRVGQFWHASIFVSTRLFGFNLRVDLHVINIGCLAFFSSSDHGDRGPNFGEITVQARFSICFGDFNRLFERTLTGIDVTRHMMEPSCSVGMNSLPRKGNIARVIMNTATAELMTFLLFERLHSSNGQVAVLDHPY